MSHPGPILHASPPAEDPMRNRLEDQLPDCTPTTSWQPLEVWVPIRQLVAIIDLNVANIEAFRRNPGSEQVVDELADALLRQRAQLRVRLEALEAVGDEYVYVALYPKRPFLDEPAVSASAETEPPFDADAPDEAETDDDPDAGPTAAQIFESQFLPWEPSADSITEANTLGPLATGETILYQWPETPDDQQAPEHDDDSDDEP